MLCMRGKGSKFSRHFLQNWFVEELRDIMATNSEVDCNEKDYSNGKSEGNILIFICVKLHCLRQ